MADLKARMVRPRIGLLPTGHLIYWDQFPGLKEMALGMLDEAREHLDKIGDVIIVKPIDSAIVERQEERSIAATVLPDNFRNIFRSIPNINQLGNYIYYCSNCRKTTSYAWNCY